MHRLITITATVISTLFICANLNAAVFSETYGFSATGISMGNALAPIVNDWSSVYYNIAGLGKTRPLKPDIDKKKLLEVESPPDENTSDKETEFYPNQIAISYFYTDPQMEIDINRYANGDPSNRLTTNAAKDLGFKSIMLGVAFDLNNVYKLSGDIVSSARLGLGLGTCVGNALTLNDIDQRTHNFLLYGREAQRLVAMAGVGLGFFDDVIGFGAGGNLCLRGEAKTYLSGTEVGPSEQTPEVQSRMDQRTVLSLVAGVYLSPGRGIRLLRGLAFGGACRQENYMEIDPFTTRNQLEIGTAIMDLELALFDFYTPEIYTGGVAYDFTNLGLPLLKGLTISLEIQLEKWSGYKVSKATEIVFNRYVQDYGLDYRLPKLDDIIVPKCGISYYIIEFWSIQLTALAGYYNQPSFVPDEAVKGKINYLDNDKNVYSGGLKFSIPKKGGFGGPINLIIGYQGQFMVDRKVTKNPQSADDYGYNPDYSYGGKVHSAIVEVSIKL